MAEWGLTPKSDGKIQYYPYGNQITFFEKIMLSQMVSFFNLVII